MKKLIFAALLLVSIRAEAKPVEYSTLYLMQWAYQCVSQMAPQVSFKERVPEQIALQFAAERCSCVIDQFREDYKKDELEAMSFEERVPLAEKYSLVCLGPTQEM